MLDFKLDFELCLELGVEPQPEGFWVELELEDLWPDFRDLEGFLFSVGYSALGS